MENPGKLKSVEHVGELGESVGSSRIVISVKRKVKKASLKY